MQQGTGAVRVSAIFRVEVLAKARLCAFVRIRADKKKKIISLCAYVSEPDLRMTERSSRIYNLLNQSRAVRTNSVPKAEPK